MGASPCDRLHSVSNGIEELDFDPDSDTDPDKIISDKQMFQTRILCGAAACPR